MVRIITITLIGTHQLLQYTAVLNPLEKNKIKYFCYLGMAWRGSGTSWHTKFDAGDTSKAQSCSRSYRPFSRWTQKYEDKSQNFPTYIGDLVQNLRTNFGPNADVKQRIQTATSRKIILTM